ncbi:MAG: 16S rRNA (adenine(1518)-N(6)/adenine(1519)-N(6))-dimethyltransferase RsmA [Saprospiraceae bacterium]|nr:16S rRNA (adenine(1518)-N(6)/adenine(1519)-N(6))-dimethyltransferase RsmA [Saprospiraceae bacterium]
MKAKKSLGQHFLNQPSIAAKIASSIVAMDSPCKVVEIGPGKGMLTQFLLKEYPDLLMIETDIKMIEVLRDRFSEHETQIIHADFLKLNLAEHISGKFILVGNYPYNISSQILFKMLENRTDIPQMVGMLQKEVAQRISANHGSKTYGILSVLLQAFYHVELLFTVSPQCFSPPPKVQSAVVRLLAKENVVIDALTEKALKHVVKLAFNQRRKMLRNSLKSIWPGHIEPEDPILNKRPEHLSVSDFLELTNRLISL